MKLLDRLSKACCVMVMTLGACGDDQPAKDVEADAATDATTTADGTDATTSDDGDTSTSDELAPTDVADTIEVSPEQAAVLGVPESAHFELAGLSAPVQVVRTEGSVPHIYAANRVDLGRVLGFVMARDRYFFIDLQRRLGLGTIAELLGALGVSRDVESRMTGMRYVTQRITASLSSDFKDYLIAFAEGINAYIDAVRAETLPPPTETQFAALLGYATAADMMKPFALEDVVALLTVFLYSTNFEGGDVGQTAAAERLEHLFEGVTDEALRKAGYRADVWNSVRGMFPDTNSTEGFGVGKASRPRATGKHADGVEKPLPAGMAQRLYDRIQARMLALGRDREGGFGSNVWAVAGTKSADGKGLLASDGHLELAVPPLAYGAGVDTRVFGGGDVHLVGGWLGSFPVMMGGTNGDIAWGGVNPVVDVTDWYREELQLDAAGKPKASKFKGEWKDLVASDETYVVADVPLLDSVGHSETWTQWTTFDGRWITSIEGRVVTSVEEAQEGETVVNLMGDLIVPEDTDHDGVITALSFDHTALYATRWAENLFAVGLAKTVEDVREATRGFVGGGLFTAAADGTGSALYTSYQSIPCRGYLPRGEDNVFIAGADPTRVLDGTLYGAFSIPTDTAGKADEGPGASDAQKCIVPFDQMPYAIDPDSGIVFNANSDPAGITDDGEERNDAWYLGGIWSSIRANTIRRELQKRTADSAATLDDMAAVQANIDSRLGESFVPFLLEALDHASVASDGPLAALQTAHGTRLDEAHQRLTGWSTRKFQAHSGVETFYHSPSEDDRADAVATMIFNAWIRRFLAAMWDDENISAWRWGSEAKATATLRFLEGRGASNPLDQVSWNPATDEAVFFDRLGSEAVESSDELMVQSLVDALAFLEGTPEAADKGGFGTSDMSAWLWGLRHQAKFQSILAGYAGDNAAIELLTADFAITTDRIPLMPSLPQGDPRRGLTWFPRNGDQWGVDAANPGIGGGGDFQHGSGPAFRLVVALKDGQVEGRMILPGGQSALIDSPYFADQLELWLGNDYYPLRFTPAEVAAGAIAREVYSAPAP